MYLRPYEKPDLPKLYALDVMCFEAPFRFSAPFLRRLLSAPGTLVQVACERAVSGAEEIVGFGAASLEMEGRVSWGYVATLDVHPEARRRGIGRLLLGKLEALAAEQGAAGMRLHVSVSNAAARELYLASGYAIQGEIADFYAPGLHAWMCEKRFAAAGAGVARAGLVPE